MKQPVFAVTSGEPAGIGPDICLDLAFARLPCRCAVLGDKNLLRARAEALGKSVVLRDFDPESGGAAYGELEVLHIPAAEAVAAGRL
ncbi:4-hydroxythreonine-4-phosphate dehydrogenase PdxA, partial [Neisseria meningitidis]|nr:4-hydroxythreonine-4-phosphate dehydrogenase PdxA [Neisseria meningitidis]